MGRDGLAIIRLAWRPPPEVPFGRFSVAAGVTCATAKRDRTLQRVQQFVRRNQPFAATSSFVRPLLTERGCRSASQPSTACSSFAWSNSQLSAVLLRLLLLLLLLLVLLFRCAVRMSATRPRSFTPSSSRWRSPRLNASVTDSALERGLRNRHLPQSHTITSPTPEG